MQEPLTQEELVELVGRVAAGDKEAFDLIVRQFERLLWSIAWSCGLSRDDAEDSIQVVWMKFLQHVSSIRERGNVAGWLSVTARRECIAASKRLRRMVPTATDRLLDRRVHSIEDPDRLVDRESAGVVRGAFERLDVRCRSLLALLLSDPPIGYADISKSLALPVGSIGPTRSRCLERLRRDPALVALARLQ